MDGKTQAAAIVTDAEKKIFLVGAGGHAKVVADAVERQGVHEISFLTDRDADLKGKLVYGYEVRGSEADLLEQGAYDGPYACIVAIGSNAIRARVAEWLTSRSCRLVSALHPSAQIGRGTVIGPGTVVMAGAVINSDASIGENVIVNTKASIDHDCVIGSTVHVAPGATICGGVTVGSGSFVCAGATILPNLTIGKNCIIGAGATVIADVPDSVTVVGCPAKPVRAK